jgi:hypothetical protein
VVTTKPAHVLGDVVDEFQHVDYLGGVRLYKVRFRTSGGDQELWIPATYALVGDDLDDLPIYDEEPLES